jgi:hypothetical protein
MARHWIVLLVAIIACSDKGALRYRPRRGGVHHYVLTMRYDREDARIISAVPHYSRVWTIYYTQFGRFTDVRGAGSELTLQIDSAQLQSTDAAPDLSPMKGQTIRVFLDGRGQLLRSEPVAASDLTPDMVFRIQAMAAATAPSFPQERVGAGDRWTITRQSPLEESDITGDLAELPLRATLNAIHKSANDRVAEVGVDGPLPTRQTRVTTSLGPLPARSSGTVIGQYRFSLPRGVMLSQELSATLMLVTDAPMVGRDTLLSRLVTQTTIRLQ